jgi:predicted ArsR family transcriptional regulator
VTDELGEQVASVAVLAEPARWQLYRYVAASPEPVSREQAAAALDMALHSAKFHLDRLADEGLLEVEYRRLTGRTGPGAGRPSKLYRRADRQVNIALPGRRYDLAGDLLAAAVERSMRDGGPVRDAVADVAREAGVELAADRRTLSGDLELVLDVLTGLDYEPRLDAGQVCLANCPFDRLAKEHTELVCGMNLSLLTGVVEGLRITTLRPRLDPEPGYCCVKLAGSPPETSRTATGEFSSSTSARSSSSGRPPETC